MSEQFTIPKRPGWGVGIEVTIQCDPTAPHSIKLGLAVKVAFASRADLSRANLSGADLSRADLSRADLSGADLSRTDLSGAYLSRANLSRANLSGACLSGAYLSRADLSGANLSRADLSGAYLSRAKIQGEKVASVFAALSRMEDPYPFHALALEAGGYKIKAGCRWFSDAEYRAHVAAEYAGTEKGAETLAILNFIKGRAKALKIGKAPAKATGGAA